MDRNEYIKELELLNARPPMLATPEGQKFSIGDVVQIVKPRSWFAKRASGHIFTVEHSYYQQFGEFENAERDKKTYSLRSVATGNRTSWYDEDELELARLVADPVLDAQLIE